MFKGFLWRHIEGLSMGVLKWHDTYIGCCMQELCSDEELEKFHPSITYAYDIGVGSYLSLWNILDLIYSVVAFARIKKNLICESSFRVGKGLGFQGYFGFLAMLFWEF